MSEIKKPLVKEIIDDTDTTSILTPLVSKYGECNIPAYFAESEEQVEFCTHELANSLFKASIFFNTVFSLLFFKKVTYKFIYGFLIFHIFLYYFDLS